MAPRAGLTTASVVDAATRVADAEGLDGLTLAGVAEALGVRPPSLYEHVDGLEGLRRALRLRGLQTMATLFRRATTGRSGDEAVRALADAFRRFALDRPSLYEATVRSAEGDTPEIKAAADEVFEILAAVLSAYRIRGREAVHAVRYLRSVLHGFTSLEASGGFGMPIDIEASYRRVVAAVLTNLNGWRARRA